MLGKVLIMHVDYLSCLVWFKEGYTGTLIYAKLITVFTPKLFPVFWYHAWKRNIQANESLKTIKEKDQLFNLMF